MDVMAAYSEKKQEIISRLADFEKFYSLPVAWKLEDNILRLSKCLSDDDSRLFSEMCFCILAANGSAISAAKAVLHAGNSLISRDKEEIQSLLKESGVRFHNRAEYIVENRERLRKEHDFKIKNMIESYDNTYALRDFLADYIKGFGMKESSHFLRNIGRKGLAILDKHIVKSMHEQGVIEEIPKSMTRKKYLEIEAKLIMLSKQLNINIDELDLLFCSMKNGRILK